MTCRTMPFTCSILPASSLAGMLARGVSRVMTAPRSLAAISRAFIQRRISRRANPAMSWRSLSSMAAQKNEGWRIRKDGSRFWARVVVTALYAPNGNLRGFAKITQDLTQKRHAENLEDATKNIHEFIAVL